MTNKEKISFILDYLQTLFPFASCELIYKKDYELLIAVMLSAQTTDKKVNDATSLLFRKYPTLLSLKYANIKDIEEIIKHLGLYKVKAKNIIGIANKLIDDFKEQIPQNKSDLMKLPGIGNKSAGVIRSEIFKIPDLAVDTHILRLSNRFCFTSKNATPIETERALKKIIAKKDWIKAHHLLIHFGRYFCKAKSPNCKNCKIRDFCRK